MRIDLLVQKTVVHNFLRIPQSTFPLLQSTVEMESSRSSTQTMTTTSSNIVETFVQIPFVEASEIRIYSLVQKTVVHNFSDSAKYVSIATVHSWNEIKPFFYSNNDDNFFQHRGNFRSNTICRSLRNKDLFTGPKDCCSQFFPIPQSTFPLLQSTVEI